MENPTLCSTDIIPIINEAWILSFARVQNNKKAISKRGWGPMNRNLLLNKNLLQTMTEPDRELFKLSLGQPLKFSMIGSYDLIILMNLDVKLERRHSKRSKKSGKLNKRSYSRLGRRKKLNMSP